MQVKREVIRTAYCAGRNKIKSKEVIIEQQKDFIQDIKNKTSEFINSVDKAEIETILLSGSVSRGDFFLQKKKTVNIMEWSI